MGHQISGVILRGGFNAEIAQSYDLLGIALDFDLTLFPIDHYYTACWAQMLKAPGQLPGQKPTSLIFPSECVIARLMMNISEQAEPFYAIIATDYFGGYGSQWALVYRGIQLASEKITQISPALQLLGAKRQAGLDEFDSLGLGRYRTMPEYLEKYVALAEQLGV
jgi:hypothetical protein